MLLSIWLIFMITFLTLSTSCAIGSEGGLKDHTHLERGVITGILRIARKNVFSDLNHSSNFTIFKDAFGDKFGLTEKEVESLLSDYGLQDKLEDVKNWYNGYHIGPYSIYNPWSILNYIEHKKNDGSRTCF